MFRCNKKLQHLLFQRCSKEMLVLIRVMLFLKPNINKIDNALPKNENVTNGRGNIAAVTQVSRNPRKIIDHHTTTQVNLDILDSIWQKSHRQQKIEKTSKV